MLALSPPLKLRQLVRAGLGRREGLLVVLGAPDGGLAVHLDLRGEDALDALVERGLGAARASCVDEREVALARRRRRGRATSRWTIASSLNVMCRP